MHYKIKNKKFLYFKRFLESSSFNSHVSYVLIYIPISVPFPRVNERAYPSYSVSVFNITYAQE